MPRIGIRVDHVGRNNMGIAPSGEHTSITREEYLRVREADAKRRRQKERERNGEDTKELS